MRLLLFFYLILIPIQTFTQNIPQNPNKIDKDNQRQGKWTILYDQYKQITSNKEKATYYRLIIYENGKPKGLTKEYYLNGKLKMVGNLISEEPEIYEDSLIHYSTFGNVINVEYYKTGQLDFENTLKRLQNIVNNQAIEMPKHPDYATSLQNLSTLYLTKSNYEKSTEFTLQALKTRESIFGINHQDYANSLSELGTIYFYQGNYAKGDSILLKSKEIQEKILGKEHPDYSLTLNNLGAIYFEQNNYSKAEVFWLESLKIKEKTIGKNMDYAYNLSNLAALYDNMGNYSKAEPLFLETLEIIQKIKGINHNDYAYTLNMLGGMYLYQNLYKKAELIINQAIEIYKKNTETENLNYANALHNLSMIYYYQGEYAKAEPFCIEALNLREKLLGKNHNHYATSLNNLALIYFHQENYDKAKPLLIGAIAIVEKSLGKMSARYGQFLKTLALMYYNQGDYENAEALFIESQEIYFKHLESQFPSFSEKEKQLYFQTFNSYFEAFNTFVLKVGSNKSSIISRLYNNTLAIKGLLFRFNEKIRQSIQNSNDKLLIEKYQTWKQKKDSLAKVYQMSFNRRKRNGIDVGKMENDVNQLEKELSQQSEVFAQATNQKRYTWQDVQKTLKKDEVAIELIRTRYYNKKWTDSVLYIVLIVKPNTKECPEMIVLPNGKEMEGKWLRYYRNSVFYKNGRGIRGDSTSDDLIDLHTESLETEKKRTKINTYEAFWQVIADKIKGYKKVYISLDGAYNSLNISTLINPQTDKFVLDEIEVHILGSTKDIIIKKLNQPTNSFFKNAVLFGFPDYNNIPKQNPSTQSIRQDMPKLDGKPRFFNGNEISELPGTKVEIESIGQILEKKGIEYQSFIYDQASESQIKNLKNPQVLHIATHGFFLADLPKVEDNTRTFSGIETQIIVENPLLRSGLLFAGAKNVFNEDNSEQVRQEDGVLTAYEAMNLNLDKTDLVILSACETGLGEIKNGEGVYGLQRAFQQAGAKSILMSLWTVSDEATQQLMSYFYINWLQKGYNKRQAFKMAQLQLRKKYPSPYHWGAFVLIGE
jgi:CHAT domain-containing protein